MVWSKKDLARGREFKREFLKAYIAEKSNRHVPEGLIPNQWSMRRKVGFIYGLTDKTYEEIGKMYGLTRERIRQLNNSFLSYAHEVSSYEFKAKYPRETIPIVK